MKYLCLAVFLLINVMRLPAQTGPFSPTLGTNNTGTGTNAWVNPANCLTNNATYSTVSTSGNTNYLFARTFGFAISSPSNIDGIQLEIDKKEATPVAVSILNAWSNGLTKTVSAGTNRCLIVVVGIENGVSVRDITSMTYGGRNMTQVLDVTAGTTVGFSDRLEVWMLLESDLALAAGTTIVPTYGISALLENVEFYTSAVFQNVDQFTPVLSSNTTASNASTNPHTLSAPFATLLNGMSVSGVNCGNNMTPAASIGGTNTYTINSGFTEGTDIYAANASFSTSGICIQTATKLCTATGTEQPTFTFAGSVNRAAMFGFFLQRARAFDNTVSLLNAGVVTGNNYATNVSWPTADTYVSYGGAADTWGRTWTVAEINNVNFGAALSAARWNGNLNVDHFRITVYSTSTLPIELLEFTATASGNEVHTNWVTATELNNDYFEIERTADGVNFESVGRVDGAGNSVALLSYKFTDANPLPGISYYRLKQTDFNGAFSYSPVVAVDFQKAQQATVYPNPAADGVFTFLQNTPATTNEVAVFSADMKLIKTVVVPAGEKVIISIADQPDGIYFLVYDSNGVRQVNKVQKASAEN